MRSPATHAPASRLGLSHARILEVALDLLGRTGFEAFNMRALAEELGVGTMTVYGYFRTKGELLDALVDLAAEKVRVDPQDGPWRQRIRQLLLSVRRTQMLHPAIVELRLHRPLLSTGALDLTEAGMRILRDAGFSRQLAARAYRVLFIYTFGFAAFGPDHGGESDRERTRAALAELPADRYPVLVDAAAEAAEVMGDEAVFEFGLERLLDGLEVLLEQH
jgi:AcrR family transcriptional regulator